MEQISKQCQFDQKMVRMTLFFAILTKKMVLRLAIKSIEVRISKCYYLDKRLRKILNRRKVLAESG